MVDKAARRAHEDVHRDAAAAGREAALLGRNVRPADDDVGAQARLEGEEVARLGEDLQGELARGAHDEGADAVAAAPAAQEQLNGRDQESNS